jgi:hypothetical protein
MVDLSKLRESGIRAILLDLDNTLVRWNAYEVSPDILRWVESLAAHEMKACIVSNTAYPKRLRRLAGELGLPFTTKAMKPRRVGFREALKLLEVSPSETVVIGDQIFTDILGGNRLGLQTILVFPLHEREFFGTKVTRLFEKLVLKYLFKYGMVRSPDEANEISGEQNSEDCSQK